MLIASLDVQCLATNVSPLKHHKQRKRMSKVGQNNNINLQYTNQGKITMPSKQVSTHTKKNDGSRLTQGKK